MKKTNRSTTMRFASVLLLVCMLVTCAVCGSVAKYTSVSSGDDSAHVAKWEITVEGTDVTDTSRYSFDLFSTIQDDGLADGDDNAVSNAADTDATTSQIIAPGTGGSVTIKLENLSEVDAKYSFDIEETANAGNVPLQYRLGDTGAWGTLAEVSASLQNIGLEIGADDEFTIYWRWCFDNTVDNAPAGQTDDSDTTLGTTAQTTAPVVTITAEVTVTQVD